jgi:hypothetical protein
MIELAQQFEVHLCNIQYMVHRKIYLAVHYNLEQFVPDASATPVLLEVVLFNQ